MLCKILVDYGAAEGWSVGDVVNITDPAKLILEGKVEEVVGEVEKKEEKKVEKVKEDKKYICEVCGYVANTGAGLKSHKRKHG